MLIVVDAAGGFKEEKNYRNYFKYNNFTKMKFGPLYILGTTLGNTTDSAHWDIVKVHAEVDEMYPGKTNISCCLKYLNIRGPEYTKVPSIYAGQPNAATKLSAYHYTCLNPKPGVVPDGVALTVSQFTCSEEDVTYRKPDTPLRESEIKLAVCTKVAYGNRSAELIIEFMEAYRYLGVDKFTCYILEDLNEDAQKVLAYYASIGIMDAYIYEPAAWGNMRIHHECEGGIEKSDLRTTDWHHRGLPRDDKLWSRGTDFSIPSSHE